MHIFAEYMFYATATAGSRSINFPSPLYNKHSEWSIDLVVPDCRIGSVTKYLMTEHMTLAAAKNTPGEVNILFFV